jgi:glycosyltransferase involved in cell wall biosynthesis
MVGPDKDGTLAQIKELASGYYLNINFTGKISKEEWRELSCLYDVFINTTHLDNVPISVLESMALGLPVVSTNVGGIPYMLENGRTGILVPDNGIKEMVRAITQLINDPVTAASISMAAREEVEKYSWNTVKIAWEELLYQVPR